MTQQTPFQQTIISFLQELEGGNKSQLTLTAYKTDLLQFFNWLAENDVTMTTPAQVTRGHVNEYLKKAGITKQISCHGLRRTFGSAKAGKGMNAFQLQKLMGHERITTTIAYVEIGQEELRRAMEATSL